MVSITVPDAVATVRKNIDETGLNTSQMFTTASEDNQSLDGIIKATIAEAVNEVAGSCPVQLLEGVTPDSITQTVTGKVVELTFTGRVLRMVAVKACDSDIVVTDETPEASPEGRMQLNRYAQGTYDRPVLVALQGKGYAPRYRYYSLKASTTQAAPITRLEYFPVCETEAGPLYHAASGSTPAYYDVPQALREAILNELTGLVLSIYGEHDKAKHFFDLTKL